MIDEKEVKNSDDIEVAEVSDSSVENDGDSGENDIAKNDILSHKDGRAWYVVHCLTGQEDKVKGRVERLVEQNEFQNKVFEIIVPEEVTIEIKNNKRIEKKTKIYPGYLFIQAILEDDIYAGIRGLVGVAKFIGSRSEPVPVTDDEILKVLRKIGDKSKKIDIDFEEGEIIKVILGPFRGYSGPISEINADKGNVKALISIFGRETPVKLDLDQVEKAVS
ncbi:MAG: transcription termination/antitermination factor NusG [bacterium]|nr:transcription termination/antitermination factor NusG [bacterium]